MKIQAGLKLATVLLLVFFCSGQVTAKEKSNPTEVNKILKTRQAEQEKVDHVLPTDSASIGDYLEKKRWSPYVVGAGLGILSWLTFLLSNHPLGCSTAYARTSGMVEKIFKGKKVEEKTYYQKFKPRIDWEWMLVAGIFLGAYLSARASGSLTFDWTPPLWQAAFGDNPVLRCAVALLGGTLLGFGSRWAGGCTSGHGLSGALQLVLSSWVAAICFFVSGIATAMLIYTVFT